MSSKIILSNRYELIRPLRSGNNGVVYLSHDTVANKQMAVKLMPVKRHDKPMFKVNRMIQSEINNMIKLRGCNHIAHLHDVVAQDDDNIYLVMEYLGGHSLHDLITAVSHEPIPIKPTKACNIVRDVAKALHECHIHDIVHGDVKPDNIIHSVQQDIYKLVDFGSSCELNDFTHSCVLDATTYAYAAPEILLYQSEPVTPAFDMWSLGKTTQDVINVTIKGQSDATLNKLVNITLVKDPKQRATAEQVLDLLASRSD